MGIKGKQILNSTISQDNMYIQTNTILSGSSVTNKEYVNQQVNQKVSGIHQSILNQHMTANIATVGQKATNKAVIEFPISLTLVNVNGATVNVGEGLDCYFSPDGVIKRSGGNAQKGDYLYWNSSNYNLDTNDEIDFNYLTGYDYVTLNSGTTITLNPFYNSIVVKYIGDSGTTMNVVVNNVNIMVGNSGGSFVWDIGGSDEHIFTTSNESIVVTINGENYTIWFDGLGSLIYSVKKGGVIVPVGAPMKLEITTTSDNTEITIPHLSGYSYNYTVNYGDGTTLPVTTYNDSNCTHTYTTTGVYTLEIQGVCETFYNDYDIGNPILYITKILQWGNVGIKKISFCYCTNLTEIATDFNGLSNMIDYQYSFSGCESLISIPEHIFDNNTSLSTNAFYSTFEYCTSLTSIPIDLFKYNTEVSNYGFAYTFYGCTSISTIPTDLFRYNTKISTYGFQGTFGNLPITEIPTDLFRYNTEVSNYGFNNTFQGCTSLTSIPTDLFRYNTKISNGGFGFTFSNCTSLTGITIDIFKYNTLVSLEGFQGTFQFCTSLTSIPTDLFRYNTEVSNYGFNSTFSNCTSLTSIPSGLFDYNTKLLSYGFQSTFQSCTSLTSIPTDLFRYNTGVTSGGFQGTFQSCTSLTSIPSGLFDYNINVSDTAFQSTFDTCTSLTSIPNGLFKYNINVSENGFNATFKGCSKLTSIPTDLFRYNINVSNYGFNYTFWDCVLLETLPTDLFRYNVLTGDFTYTFNNCSKLQLNQWIFYASGEEGTRFSGLTCNFTNCFNRGSFTGTQGTAPDLWNCTFNTVTRYRCYYGNGNSNTSLTNYNDIPTNWKS